MNDRLDPLAAGAGIEDAYKRYLTTLLAPRDQDLAAAFDTAVDGSAMLTKGPMLEITPPYAPGAAPADLIDEGVLRAGIRGLDRNLPITRPLYRHQETAIRKAVAGRNLVVSTGTGSGKTESFLLPILNDLIAEREAGTLGPGVRAILLYPMNALANDQVKRLRTLLADMPDLTFGRYTGETKESAREAEEVFRAANPGENRLANELLSREEMRETPPHILLTNYAMLEYLLLRPADIELFDSARSGTWKYVVLDEAHVYDGAQGAEVGLLLRRLRERVASGNSLQCIATSASLTGSTPETQGQEATKFARHLFDAPFEFVDADPDRQDLVTATRQQRREKPSWELTDEELSAISRGGDDLTRVADSRVDHVDGERPADALHAERHLADVRALLAGGPVDVREVEAALWPNDPEAGRKLEALIALGSHVSDDAQNPVLSARYHMFVRATEGAFVSFGDEGPRVFLGRHEKDPETGRAVFEFGTCQRCGAVHLAGDLVHMSKSRYFRPAKNERAVHWVVITDAGRGVVIDEDEETLGKDKSAAEARGFHELCTGCGAYGENTPCADDCPGGRKLSVREHGGKTRIMSECTECGARARQVIRRLRTDTNAAPAVLTTALYQELPTAADATVEQVGEGRKLLMFSDSRQAAAFAAPYLDRTYGRLLQRRYLTDALTDPEYAGDELSPADLASLAGRKATEAHHFAESATRMEVDRTVNPWVMAELMAMDQRQSLEGLGLMAVSMVGARQNDAPRALTRLGLTNAESWGLLEELLKTIRIQGAVTLLRDVDIRSEIFEPRNLTIRVRSRDSDAKRHIISWLPAGRPGTTNKRIQLVTKVLEAVGADLSAEKVLDGCWRFLLNEGYVTLTADKFAGDVYQADHTRLRIRSGLETRWYECSSCRRLTANNVQGVCPQGGCDGALAPFAVPQSERDSNHYRVLYRTMNPAPMTATEHTAQWAAETAAEIQREFISGKVNVLSCSTTFELGVDVGDLESVMLRNMPPKTANYVQRAGRAGRRAASAALVLTYAKRSSHDLSKYQNPESMIAGRMRIPWVPIDNERIARRHVHSVALAAYFRHRSDVDGLRWRYAGDFFSAEAEGQPSPASRVRNFLTPVPDDVRQAAWEIVTPAVGTAIGLDDGSWVAVLADLLDSSESDIQGDVELFSGLIDEAAAKRNFELAKKLEKTLATVKKRQLMGYLANKNILPKYGFPVDTVELRTLHCEGDVGRNLELDRDLSQAIFDYAPGSQVVAGGSLFTSRGLRKLPGRELYEYKYRVCKNCDRFELGRELDASTVCPRCHDAFSPIRTLVVPEFGFIADAKVEDVGSRPPERVWGRRSFVESIGEVIDTFEWTSAGGMPVEARAGTRAEMVVVSEGYGGGFSLCGWCGWAEAFEQRAPKRKHKNPVTGKECNYPTRPVSLAHRYQTDVAEFTFGDVAYDKESEAQWRSALYALLESASEALEISRDDIDGTLAWGKGDRRSIVLFDTVPAGAGAAKKIAENLGRVVEFAVARVADCDCGEETSCYGCLRSYRNNRFHDELSRAGALEIFRKLRIDAAEVRTGRPWDEVLIGVSESVEDLLCDLASRGAPKPIIGIDFGKHYWPVEAVWRDQSVVLVEYEDEERDASLAADGFTVVHVGPEAAAQTALLVGQTA